MNKETILSSFNDKLTLLQWLKNLEKTIKETNVANVKEVEIIKDRIENKFKLVVKFESGEIVESKETPLSWLVTSWVHTLTIGTNPYDGSEEMFIDVITTDSSSMVGMTLNELLTSNIVGFGNLSATGHAIYNDSPFIVTGIRGTSTMGYIFGCDFNGNHINYRIGKNDIPKYYVVEDMAKGV